MRHLISFNLYESKDPSDEHDKEIQKFKSKWGIELDPEFTLDEIEIISKGLSYYDTAFIKNKIQKIIRKDLGGVKGRWTDTPKKKWMTLNPKIFKYKRRWTDDDTDIPYALFTVVHEVAHCVDYIERISFTKEWQSISGWKKCDIDKRVPDGYKRYIERRPGREEAGPKKSNWIHREDADFCRKYTSRNPREDFADSLAFVMLGFPQKLKGEDGKKKMEIIKRVLKKVD